MTQPVGEVIEPQDAVSCLDQGQARLYEKIPTSISYVSHPSFSFGYTEEELFGSHAEIVETPGWVLPQVIEDEGVAVGTKKKPLSRDAESALFLRYNYARYRLNQLIEVQRKHFSPSRAKQMLAWYGRILKLRAGLVDANLALVLAMAKRTKIAGVEFVELVSEGNLTLLRAIEKFDVSRGFKFSTYACRAILKGFNRMFAIVGRHYQRFPSGLDTKQIERNVDGDFPREWWLEDALEELGNILGENNSVLSEIEMRIVIARFGIGTQEKGKTIRQVVDMVGLSRERIRTIQIEAVGKIRLALKSRL